MDYSSYFNNPHEKNNQKGWQIFEELSIPSLLYGANQMVYFQGEISERFYYLKSGSVKIFITSQNGTEKTLTILQKGNVFGEAAFFDHLPRVSSAKTLEKSEILVIDRKILTALFTQNPSVAMDMLTYLAKTIRMLSAQVDHMTFWNADKRIAQLLVNLKTKENIVNITHEEIGNLIGATRITVSKTLTKFSAKGWIETRYRSIFIKEEALLSDYAFQEDK